MLPAYVFNADRGGLKQPGPLKFTMSGNIPDTLQHYCIHILTKGTTGLVVKKKSNNACCIHCIHPFPLSRAKSSGAMKGKSYIKAVKLPQLHSYSAFCPFNCELCPTQREKWY